MFRWQWAPPFWQDWFQRHCTWSVNTAVVKAIQKIAESVVCGYHKIEEGVVSGFTRITDKFVDEFLTKEGESVEDAKRRLAAEQAKRQAGR